MELDQARIEYMQDAPGKGQSLATFGPCIGARSNEEGGRLLGGK